MDQHKSAFLWELVKCVFGATIILFYGDWFGASLFIPWLNILLLGYFISSLAVTAWFVLVGFKNLLQ